MEQLIYIVVALGSIVVPICLQSVNSQCHWRTFDNGMFIIVIHSLCWCVYRATVSILKLLSNVMMQGIS